MKIKKMFFVVLAAGFLAVFAGCLSYSSFKDSYLDGFTTAFLPGGTVQWASAIDKNAAAYAKKNTNTEGGEQYNNAYEECAGACRDKISQAVRSSKEELEQLGKQVYTNREAGSSAVEEKLEWLEQRLRTLPSGTRLVYGGTAPQQHDILAVAFLSDDGAFDHYLVED
jgi:hypothetical protein